jgi:hypothetical protein
MTKRNQGKNLLTNTKTNQKRFKKKTNLLKNHLKIMKNNLFITTKKYDENLASLQRNQNFLYLIKINTLSQSKKKEKSQTLKNVLIIYD